MTQENGSARQTGRDGLTPQEQRILDALPSQSGVRRTTVTSASRRATVVGILAIGVYASVLLALFAVIADRIYALFYSAGLPLSSVLTSSAILCAALFALLFWLPPFRGLANLDQENYRVVPRSSAHFLYAVGDRLNEMTGRASQVEFRISLGAHAMVFREKKKTVVEIGASVLWMLSTSQLLAVLAHEFAHTSQAGGRTTLGWIRRFNARLARAYLPWPLLDPVNHAGNWLQQVLIPVRNALLQPLLQLHRTLDAVLKAMSREMEFEADGVAVEMVGADGLKDGLRRVALVEACQNEFLSGFETLRESNYLPRDFSQPPAINAEILDERLKERGGIQYGDGKQSIYESHPSLKSRIDHADSIPNAGSLPIDVDECELFLDLEPQTIKLTANAMKSLHVPPGPDAFVEMEEYLGRIDVVRLYMDAENRYFGGTGLPSPSKLFQAKYISKPTADSVEAVISDLEQLRQQLRGQADDIEDQLQSKSLDYVLPEQGLSKVIPAFDALMDTGARRLTLAYAALGLEDVQTRCECADELQHELNDHRETAGLLPKLETRIVDIDRGVRSFAFAYQVGDEQRAHAALGGIEAGLKGIEFIVDTSPYLYRGERYTSLRDYFLGPGDYTESMDALLHAATRSLEAFRTLSSRIVGALCRVAEEIEFALGLLPIEGTMPAQRQLPRRIASRTIMVRKTAKERAEAFKQKLQGAAATPANDDAAKARDAEALQRTPNLHQSAALSAGHLVWIALLVLVVFGRFLVPTISASISAAAASGWFSAAPTPTPGRNTRAYPFKPEPPEPEPTKPEPKKARPTKTAKRGAWTNRIKSPKPTKPTKSANATKPIKPKKKARKRRARLSLPIAFTPPPAPQLAVKVRATADPSMTRNWRPPPTTYDEISRFYRHSNDACDGLVITDCFQKALDLDDAKKEAKAFELYEAMCAVNYGPACHNAAIILGRFPVNQDRNHRANLASKACALKNVKSCLFAEELGTFDRNEDFKMWAAKQACALGKKWLCDMPRQRSR